jgi:hypothetical protein
MQVDSGGHKAGCFFVNFVILKIWRIPELVKFTLEKKRFSKIFPTCFWKEQQNLWENKTGKGGPNLEYCIQQKITQTKKCQILLSQKDT